MLNRATPILNFVSTNRTVLLALSVGLNISSIYAAPHEAQKPAHNNRQLRIIQPLTSFAHAEVSGTLGIAELQKRFHPGDSSIKDPGECDGPVFRLSTDGEGGPWKENIVATTFWIGEPTSSGSPSNTRSAWDSEWMAHYGGEDSPTQRVNFLPTGFTPRQNPFYIALPYSDVSHGQTKPEAAQVVPWFKSSFSQHGHSILKIAGLLSGEEHVSATPSGRMPALSVPITGSMSSVTNGLFRIRIMTQALISVQQFVIF